MPVALDRPLSGGLRGMPRQYVAAIAVLVAAIALAVPMARQEGILAALWALGLAAGFTLQRSRVCFASAYRDLSSSGALAS